MHIIQKNIIEVELPASEDAFLWQDVLVRLCEEKMEKILEEILNELDNPTATIEIDQIHIKLENIRINDFEKQFLEAIKVAIRIELSDKIMLKKQDFLTLPNEIIFSPKPDLQLFIYFLKNGTFPWWTDVTSTLEIETKITKYLTSQDKENLRKTFAEAFKSDSVKRRFIWQFSKYFQHYFLYFFNTQHEQILRFFEAILNEIIQLEKPNEISKQALHETIKIELLESIIQSNKLFTNKLFENIFFKLNLKHLLINQKSASEIEDLVQKIAFIIQEKKQTHPSISKNINIDFFKDSILEKMANEQSKLIKEIRQENPYTFIEEIYINNAGLVLLAPFLSEYLKSFGVIQKEELVDANIAVHALQYLITGKQKTSENELVLNKILCGIPIDTEVVSGVELSNEIKNEAKKMLEAVIFYWDILQDTSIEGLQNSFLQRKGKISVRDDGDWLLQVEQAGYDMLLGHLPWTYSIIKLPTMHKTLWVEWA